VVGFLRGLCHAVAALLPANTMQTKPGKCRTPRTAQVGAAMHHAQKLIEHA